MSARTVQVSARTVQVSARSVQLMLFTDNNNRHNIIYIVPMTVPSLANFRDGDFVPFTNFTLYRGHESVVIDHLSIVQVESKPTMLLPACHKERLKASWWGSLVK